ncbi:MAG: DUF896 domain-containing protein [Clostridiales bacterium]
MDKDKIARINALAKKAKESELTMEETLERADLRKEYLESVKANMRATLDNVLVENEKGEYEALRTSDSGNAKRRENRDHKHLQKKGCGCGCGCGGEHHHHH